MGSANQKRATGGWRAFLCIVLAAALALCMTPVGALEAQAASTAKSYVYNHVYGTYSGQYALGFTWNVKGDVNPYKGDQLKEVDILSATGGVTLKVKSSALAYEGDLDSWVYQLMYAYGEAGSKLPGTVGVPVKVGGSQAYQPYTLAGKKLSNTTYRSVDYFQSSQLSGGGGALFSRLDGGTLIADLYSDAGKKIQTLSIPVPAGYEDAGVYAYDLNGKVYCVASAYSEDEGEAWNAYYLLKNGKFEKSAAPAESFTDSAYVIGGGVSLETSWDDDDTERAYLKQPNGTKIELPSTNGMESYDVVKDLGVSIGNGNGSTTVYNKQGKVIKTINTGQKNTHTSWEKSAIPGAWVLICDGSPYAAYNSSLNEITRANASWYLYAQEAGKLNGKAVYTTIADSSKDWERYIVIDGSAKQVKVAGYALEANYRNTPIHTFSNGRSVVIAKNSKGKYGVIDTAGNVLVPFSYSDYANVGGGDYIMMKASKGWQFVKVSQFASGKAVKGITYTVGKLKYKVTSTSSKNRTVMVVGHVSGTKAKGKLSIPSTVKIGGQKFKVTEVGASAFKGSAITSVTVGAYVTKVGASAFSSCKKLTKATLGKKVKSLGKSAFSGCKKLKTITIKSKVLKSVGKSALKNVYKKAKIKVPSSKVKAYKKLFKSSTGFKKTMKVTK
ncbi:leucine-rich repeat domain-containing protein [uncultured Adlercreutzia sp.]|uniref:leucine-rich repeat domain-containing protein n=1 Tax=uncultured Adlercreutzia sp. TaxID=875803 RepID=UPI0025E32D60|nr:leucine-rich repeat domain-containing protein [uncultured Adlercreutzia sp.]MCI9261495.1 leucine-rich repeat domain-containing protein [Eggerthellaceae bacterium]